MGEPFLGTASGLTKDRLRGPGVRRLHRGVYVQAPDGGDLALPEPTAYDELVERCRAALLVFPDAVVCGTTAAALARLPVDDDAVVHLDRGRTAARSRRAGVRVHRLSIPPAGVRRIAGLRVAADPRLLADLSAGLDLEGVVALGDPVLRRFGVAAVHEAAVAHGRRRGAVMLRRALPLLDPGSDSPAESRGRLRLHAAGFTALRHQVDVRDAHGGWLARPDLADPVAQVAVQHDGLVHWTSGPARWRHDLDQDELVRAAGWQLVRTTAIDDAVPARLIAKVAAAYRRSARWQTPAS